MRISNTTKHRLLVSAFGCWPGKGSELGVGWEWCVQMAKNNELHIITIRRSRNDIEASLPKLSEDIQRNMHFHYFDYPTWLIKALPAGTSRWYLYYLFWQIGIIATIKKLHRHFKFDYTMALTFGSVWLPTFLPLFRTPFIWGPWGGADFIPNQYLKSLLPKKKGLLQWAQSKRQWLAEHVGYLPHIRFVMHRASALLCRTNGNCNAVPLHYKDKCYVILETAISTPFCQVSNTKRTSKPVRILTTGRLIPRKNISMAIKAVSEAAKTVDINYDIIGDGPELANLERFISECNANEKITLIKSIPREQLLAKLPDYDIYLFPSLLEGGSWALMEAMGYGLPVICFNGSGMRVITDENCAIRLPFTHPQQSQSDMTEAIIRLASRADLRQEMGKNAAQRIREEFCWEKKGEFMEQLFEKLEKKDTNND